MGKGIEKGKSDSALGWPGVIGKCGAIFLQLFQLVSDRSVWYNGKHPTIGAELLIGHTWVVYHLLGKTGWFRVAVNGTCQMPNWDALVSFPRLFTKDRFKDDPVQNVLNY